MTRRPDPRCRPDRSGVILLIVLVLLALFAVLGLLFVSYAQSEATAANTFKTAVAEGGDPRTTLSQSGLSGLAGGGAGGPGVAEADEAFKIALGQLLYGVLDTDGSPTSHTSTRSALRGYSLADTKFGFDSLANSGIGLSLFSGQGRVTDAEDTDTTPRDGVPRSQVISFQHRPGITSTIVDPGRVAGRTDVTTAVSGSYKNPAAGYTYPDLKDLYLAVIDPTTGQVLQPSFHRNWLFDLAATNADWTSAAGKWKILRPRPEDHKFDSGDGRNTVTDFPAVPVNADGSTTGDVQNWLWANGRQKNDSLWLYTGGPIRTWNGKRYTALIAPLVIDLNGRVNLAVAGNRKGPGADGTPGTPDDDHASSQGLGPWEINPRWVFDPVATTRAGLTAGSLTALQRLLNGATFQTATGTQNVNGRNGFNTNPPPLPTPADRLSGLPQLALNGHGPGSPLGRVPPFYARLDADAVGAGAGDRVDPVGTGTSPFPTFAASRYYDSTSQNTELTNHPGQFNPAFWPTGTTAANEGRTFRASDVRWLAGRYSDRPENYSNADPARLLPDQLLAGPNTSGGAARYNPATASSGPTNFLTGGLPAGTFNPNPYSAVGDQAQLVRMLTTPVSKSTHRPELTLPTDAGGGVVRLGPIDVSRPLPDYRQDPTRMLGPDNMGNAAAAQLARQNLARDIFVRLVAGFDNGLLVAAVPTIRLVDGTQVRYVNDPTQPDYGFLRIDPAVFYNPRPGSTTPEAQRFEMLQLIAQLAVNMVDYSDPDDVATTFTWNPGDGVSVTAATGFPGGTLSGANLGDHVVFGVELPRLVVNELYGEVGNHPSDYNPAKGNNGPPPDLMDGGKRKAAQNFQKRFWVELFNPLRADPQLSENGLARLHYPAGVFGVTNPFSPYALFVTQTPTPNPMPPAAAANVTGSPKHPRPVSEGTQVIAQVDRFTYDAADFPADPSVDTQAINEGTAYPVPPVTPSAGGTNLERYVVHPTSGAGNGTNASNQNGFAVLGPSINFPGQTAANSGTPAATIRVQSQASTGTPAVQSTLQVDLGSRDATAIPTAAQRAFSCQLMRLANPYLPPNDPYEAQPPFNPSQPINPYIAVSSADANLFDNVKFAADGERTPGDDPLTNQFSRGRSHPYSITEDAQQTTAVTGSPRSTFFQTNDRGLTAGSGDYGQTGLPWVQHLDRAPLSGLELAFTQCFQQGRSFVRSTTFSRGGEPNGRSAVDLLIQGLFGVNTWGSVNDITPNLSDPPTDEPRGLLHPALDLLQTRPHSSGQPVGGVEQGRVNLNTAWHPSVLRALFDASDANRFTDADVARFWGELNAAGGGAFAAFESYRTRAFPDVSAADQPITSLATSRGRIQRTVLRIPDGNANGLPLFFTQPTAAPPGNSDPVAGNAYFVNNHPTTRTEPLRKVWNSVTTTSDNFLVVFTVGFFEVRNNPTLPTDRVVLGRELFAEVPGDLRQKYVAVVDRSNLAVDLDQATGLVPLDAGRPRQADQKPWFTVLDTDIQPQPGPTPADFTCEVQGQLTGVNPNLTLSVFADGQAVPIGVSAAGSPSFVRIGFGDAGRPPAAAPTPGTNVALQGNGADGERFEVVGIAEVLDPMNNRVPGRARLTLRVPAGGTQVGYHPAGSPVSNVLLANPGPQPAFDPASARYQTVVPYFARITGQ